MSVNDSGHKFLFLLAALLMTDTVAFALPETGLVSFSQPNGPYLKEMYQKDFGELSNSLDFMHIESNSLRITYPKGVKLKGAKMRLKIPPAHSYTLIYKIRYDASFEKGLHGKQLGLMGGAAYTGGTGEQARTNGNGWSVRLSFDAEEDRIRNRLYVYHVGMTGKYGASLRSQGGTSYSFPKNQWQTVALRVTMQTDVFQSDGRIEVWLNGEKKMDVDGIRFVSKEEGRKVDSITLSTFTGGGGMTPTRDNFVYIDDLFWDQKAKTYPGDKIR